MLGLLLQTKQMETTKCQKGNFQCKYDLKTQDANEQGGQKLNHDKDCLQYGKHKNDAMMDLRCGHFQLTYT